MLCFKDDIFHGSGIAVGRQQPDSRTRNWGARLVLVLGVYIGSYVVGLGGSQG